LNVAYIALHAALLMSLADIAVVALEQVVAAEGFEGFLLFTVVPFQNTVDRRFQVVVVMCPS
jgi:hypothetical protein